MPRGLPIFSPRRNSCARWRVDLRRSALIAALAGLALVFPVANSVASEECQGLLKRFNRLIDLYHEEGAKAIADGQDPPKALEQARGRALKGDAQATVTMVGVTLLIYGRRDMFPVSIIRQVCNLAAKNTISIHVVTCAYFNALNPLGDKEDKRRAVEGEIERFEKALKPPAPGVFAPPNEYLGHVDALKACLARG